MSLSHYSAQTAPAMSLAQPPMRRLVLIDSASRLATRILGRTSDAFITITPEVGPQEIEAFRLGCGDQVFANVAAQLAKTQHK